MASNGELGYSNPTKNLPSQLKNIPTCSVSDGPSLEPSRESNFTPNFSSHRNQKSQHSQAGLILGKRHEREHSTEYQQQGTKRPNRPSPTRFAARGHGGRHFSNTPKPSSIIGRLGNHPRSTSPAQPDLSPKPNFSKPSNVIKRLGKHPRSFSPSRTDYPQKYPRFTSNQPQSSFSPGAGHLRNEHTLSRSNARGGRKSQTGSHSHFSSQNRRGATHFGSPQNGHTRSSFSGIGSKHHTGSYRRSSPNIRGLTRHGPRPHFSEDPHLEYFTEKELRSLSEKSPDEVVDELLNKIKAFQETLGGNRRMTLDQPGVMDAIVIMLSKVAGTLSSDSTKPSLILAEVLSDRCALFQVALKTYVTRLCDTDPHLWVSIDKFNQRIECVLQLFRDLLRSLPESAWSVLPVDELQRVIKESCPADIQESFQENLDDIVTLRNCAQQSREQKSSSHDDDQSSDSSHIYRQIPILPRWSEVCTPKKPRLHANIIKGRYSGWSHYFDVQFRLLREDFVAPLRNGICDYLNGARGRKLKNVRVYQNVLIKRPAFASTALCYTIKLDFSHMRRRCNWAHSKRLLHGSLLCLSPEKDNFNEEIYFATVVNRELKMIEKGELEVMFQDNAKILSFSCTDTRFTLVESCAYFEASRHILHSLQTAEVDTMPFTAHLIAGNCDSVNQPRYLRESIFTQYNLSFLLTDEEKSLRVAAKSDSVSDDESDDDSLIGVLRRRLGVKHQSISLERCFVVDQIINFNQWPSSDQTKLDHSQMKALQMGLTQEIAVIQGPPGTGKTFIGLKIVEALLLNKINWKTFGARSPILVMCYTNHALDQFLEGILADNSNANIIRIGGRSQSEKITNLSLRNRRKTVRLPKSIRARRYSAESDVRWLEEECRELVLDYFKIAQNRKLLSLEDLEIDIIPPYLYSQLFLHTRSIQQKVFALENWLYFSDVGHREVLAAHNAIQGSEADLCTRQSSTKKPNIGVKTHEIVDSDSDSDHNQIDITGEATIEQFGRILDDDFHHPLKKIAFSNDQVDYAGIIDRLSGDTEAWNGVEMNTKWAKTVLEAGFSFTAMSKREASRVRSIHNLSFKDRWKLYLFWRAEYLNHLCRRCECKFDRYNQACKRQEEARKAADRYALETADIIGITTTGAAKYQHILHQVKPRIVIVEEAAEVLESHIVSALNAGTQHLILIGDHKQLRPKPNEYELAKKYNLDVSLFERLVRNGFPHATLEYQHRMRPEIAELVKPHIYTTLSNHKAVLSYPDVRGVSTNLFFINHCQEEKEDDNIMSHSNAHEASYLVSLCKYLLQQRYTPQQITILVTYAGQLLAMRKLMPRNEFEGVRVSTVDNFQGEENDIILLSLVRSNGDNNVGFLKEENRVCVALSRARQGFYCIGNFTMLRSQVPLWDTIMSDMESKSKLGDGPVLHCSNHPEMSFTAVTSQDFDKNSPIGGCNKDCTFRLPCGHACAKKCHYTNPEHVDYQCYKPCLKKCPEGHPCCRKCSELCSRCKKRVTRLMPSCGHDQEMFCYEDPSEVDCTNPCMEVCPQGHPCPLLCHQECKPCTKIVSVTMPLCKHEQHLACHMDPMQATCRAACSKKCKDGHPCPKRCYEDCGDCKLPVVKTITECNHKVSLPCCVKPKRKVCPMPCERVLACDHKCRSKCGEDCSSKECKEQVTVKLPCEHEAVVPCHQSQNLLKVFCNEKCEQKLPCGHSCILKCGDPCNAPCPSEISSIWPCGHRLKRPCYQSSSPEEYPCRAKCKKVYECGHQCSKLCFQPCDEKCMEIVNKHYPCGHKNEICCSSSISEFPCELVCSHILACGHKCSGQCAQCSARRMHEPCSFQIEIARFCGHRVQVSCLGLADSHPGNRNLSLPCSHRINKKTCTGDLRYTCYKPCEWNCTHFECSKTCSEYCTRRRCNVRCHQKLRCGHQCYGLCGEPCLSICPQCDPRRFASRLRSPGKFNKDAVYYQLWCKDIFLVKYLDDYVQHKSNPSSDILVRPLKCPHCPILLSSSHRYGNQVKRVLSYVQGVNATVKSGSTKVRNGGIVLRDHANRLASDSEYYTEQTFLSVQMIGLQIRGRYKTIHSDHNVHVQYEPLPEISASFHKLKTWFLHSNQKFLGFMFLEGMELLEYLLQLSSDPDTTATEQMREVKLYLIFVSKLIDVHHFKLSFQIVSDLRNALLRLFLSTYFFLARQNIDTGSPDADVRLIVVQSFLEKLAPSNSPVTTADFQHHMDTLSKLIVLDTVPDYKKMLSDLDAYWPDVHKGQWWRCAQGHYYCSLPSVLDSIETKCPECKGDMQLS